MRATFRTALMASALGLFAASPAATALAQDAPPAAGMTQVKQVPLTQKQIDGVVASQQAIQTIEAKQPQGADEKPDPKVEAALDAVVKKNGFANIGEYSDVSSSIGIVMAGMDPQTKTYVGPDIIIKKQIADLQADKSMPPKEKTEALAELKDAMGSAASAKPLPANIEIVGKNFDALAKSLQSDAN